MITKEEDESKARRVQQQLWWRRRCHCIAVGLCCWSVIQEISVALKLCCRALRAAMPAGQLDQGVHWNSRRHMLACQTKRWWPCTRHCPVIRDCQPKILPRRCQAAALLRDLRQHTEVPWLRRLCACCPLGAFGSPPMPDRRIRAAIRVGVAGSLIEPAAASARPR